MTVIAAPAAAQIALHSASAASGSTVEGSGSGFSPAGNAVQLHLDEPDGSTLWSGAPDRGGAVMFSFTVPSAAPGSHTVVATQAGRDGEPVDGTPAMAPLQITNASGSPAPTQQGQPQNGEGNQQKQPASQSHGQPQVPGVSSVTAVPSIAGTPVTVSPPAAAPVVFSLPTNATTRLTNPPPQVATMWRVDGAAPSATTVTGPLVAPTRPAPATSTGSREAPSALTLVALAVLVASAVVLIATTLQLRSAEVTTPEAAPAAPQRQRAQRGSATMRSADLWSGSPARLR